MISQYATELTTKLLTERQIGKGYRFDTANDVFDMLDAQAKSSVLCAYTGAGKEKSHHHDKHKEHITKLENELKEEKEKTLRIQAEMMNFKRRQEESLATYKKYANESILKELLLIKDNFERGLSLENDENKEIFKGFRMIYQNIDKILEENEVTEINAIDVEFDPAVHQAVMTEHKDGIDAGMVIDCLQKGYKYKDRVLRPAMVKVSE